MDDIKNSIICGEFDIAKIGKLGGWGLGNLFVDNIDKYIPTISDGLIFLELIFKPLLGFKLESADKLINALLSFNNIDWGTYVPDSEELFDKRTVFGDFLLMYNYRDDYNHLKYFIDSYDGYIMGSGSLTLLEFAIGQSDVSKTLRLVFDNRRKTQYRDLVLKNIAFYNKRVSREVMEMMIEYFGIGINDKCYYGVGLLENFVRGSVGYDGNKFRIFGVEYDLIRLSTPYRAYDEYALMTKVDGELVSRKILPIGSITNEHLLIPGGCSVKSANK